LSRLGRRLRFFSHFQRLLKSLGEGLRASSWSGCSRPKAHPNDSKREPRPSPRPAGRGRPPSNLLKRFQPSFGSLTRLQKRFEGDCARGRTINSPTITRLLREVVTEGECWRGQRVELRASKELLTKRSARWRSLLSLPSFHLWFVTACRRRQR